MQAASAGSANPQVVVVQPPIYPLVAELMRGTGTPTLLIRPGQDSHHFQLNPSQAEALAKADVIIVADRAMTVNLNKQIQARADKGATVIALTELDGADPLLYRTRNSFTAGKEAKTGFVDPHIWLDPVRMASVMQGVAVRLGKVNMAFQATYLANAKTLASHLREEVHNGVSTILEAARPAATKDIIPYITYHDAYQYFEQRYHLSPVGYVTQRPEEYIGAAAMQGLMESSQSHRVRCLIAESRSPLAKRFALHTEAKIVSLSPERLYSAKDAPTAAWIRNDYDRLLAKTATVFAGCRSGKLGD